MLNRAINLIRRALRTSSTGYGFGRPLVLLQSDDWGRVGVCDREGFDQLRAAGVSLGEQSYDFYSLEAADDVDALRNLLGKHRDSAGREARITMNFLTANLDFTRMAENDFQQIHTLPLVKGLPGEWSRPGLFEAYRAGINAGVFYPALHGSTHFCSPAIDQALAANDERAELLDRMWRAGTPYIYWRMPWIGYEYYNPGEPQSGFLASAMQDDLVADAAAMFQQFFGSAPASACAPGYRSNNDTDSAWLRSGIRIAQHGSGTSNAPRMGNNGLLHLYRTFDFEPCIQGQSIEKYMRVASKPCAQGRPLIISVHSINFHSSLKDFRSETLTVLDELLSALERQYPDLLYVNDADLYEIVTTGKLTSSDSLIPVHVTKHVERLTNPAGA